MFYSIFSNRFLQKETLMSVATKAFWTIACLMLFPVGIGLAQSAKRLQPGTLYEAGEKIYAPRYGFNGVIPEGWEGVLPRETELFLLMPNGATGGEIFTFASQEKDIPSIKANWTKGAALTESIFIRSAGEIAEEGDMIISDVVASGENVNRDYKGFIAARCSPHGPCVTSLGIGPSQFYEQVKAAVTSFLAGASFTEPSNESIYSQFDWKEFLAGKSLIAFSGAERGSEIGYKENVFHLCPDGTFSATIKKKGLLKEYNPDYKGKQSGTWSVEGIGDQGVLRLKFKKLPEAVVDMMIADERISANGERYYAAYSDKCKD